MIFGVSDRTLNGCAVISLRSELDLAAAPTAQERVLAVIAERPGCIVLDLSDLTSLSACGLRVLLVAQQHASQNHRSAETCAYHRRPDNGMA